MVLIGPRKQMGVVQSTSAGSGRGFWFDLDAGSDGEGTQESPYNSLKYLNNPNATVGVEGYDGIIPEDNDTYYIKGTSRGANRLSMHFTSGGSHDNIEASNCTIRGWPGAENWHLTTFQILPVWNKTALLTNVYEFDMSVIPNVPGTPSVYLVAYNYEDFETPGTNGKITPENVWMVAQTFSVDLASTLALLDANAGRYYFDAGGNKLYIHAPASADPNTAEFPVQAAYYDTTTTTAMISIRSPSTARGCSGWTLQDVTVSGYTLDARSIEVLDSDNFDLDNYEVWYAGDDAVAFAGGGARNAYIHDGFIAGQNARSGAITSDTGIVIFTDSASVKLSGNLVENVDLHYFTLKTTAGADLHAPSGSGLATHSSNMKEGMDARGIVFKNCRWYGYSVASNAISVNSGKIPTDIYDPDTYGVVFEDCRWYECVNFNSRKDADANSGGEQVAFKRCYIYSTTSANQQINLGAGCTWYNEFCVWDFFGTTTTHISAGQALGDGRKHRWISRCSFYHGGSATAALGIFTVAGTAITDGAQFHMDGDVYYRPNAGTGRWFRAGTGAELYDLTGSSTQINIWLFGMTVPLFGVAAADTVAEFQAVYDPGGQSLFAINPDVELSADASLVRAFIPTTDGDIATRTRPGSPTTKTGIDLATDSDHWGPWQGDYTS